MKLSIIISTFNEENNDFYKRTIHQLRDIKEIELIIVDKNSSDQTCQMASQLNHRVIKSKSNARGKRLDEGFRLAKGEMILFHHPRSYIDLSAINTLISGKNLTWGGLTHIFDHGSHFLNFTSWYSNKVRADIREIFYLDHCIYVRRKLLEKISLNLVTTLTI